MTTEKKIELKKKLLKECIRLQTEIAARAKEVMAAAQETANDEKSTMEDKFESFREQMQIERDMYAQRYDEAMGYLENLEKIDVSRIRDAAAAGTVVVTPGHKYFASHSLGKIIVEGETFMAISPQSPIFRAFAGKKKGESYVFRDEKVKIEEVF